MKTYKVGFIGTGGRSVAYASHYVARDDIEIVALADPSAPHRKQMMKRAGITNSPAEYDDFTDLLREHTDLDGMVIASPNYFHAAHAVACFERGLPVALEKPLATTPGDCERILDAERANNGRSLLGFVLRSTPFYGRIKELIAAGAIGRVTSIQADELVGWGVTSLMNRNPWRRLTALSGGSMLEKCCHDMDILNWMMDARPVAVQSFGGTRVFNPNPELPNSCEKCPHEKTCHYYQQPVFADHEDEGEVILHQFMRQEQGICIYNIRKDVTDTQSMNIEFENGSVATFMLCFHAGGPRAGRNFHAVGTRGRIWGNINELQVSHYDNATDKTTTYDTSGDGSGHGGGDRRHALELHRMMTEPAYMPEQNAYAGYLSAMMCFAADRSRQERRTIDLRYTGGGMVELA